MTKGERKAAAKSGAAIRLEKPTPAGKTKAQRKAMAQARAYTSSGMGAPAKRVKHRTGKAK